MTFQDFYFLFRLFHAKSLPITTKIIIEHLNSKVTVIFRFLNPAIAPQYNFRHYTFHSEEDMTCSLISPCSPMSPMCLLRDGPFENLWGGGGGGSGRSTKKNIPARENKLKKNSCTPINPKKYSCYGLKKNSYEEFDNEKKFLRVENSPPHYNFSNGPSLSETSSSPVHCFFGKKVTNEIWDLGWMLFRKDRSMKFNC